MPGRTFLDSLLTPASGSVYREWSSVIVCRLSKQSKKQKLIILQIKNNFKTVSGIKTAFYYIMLQQQYFGTTLGSPYIFVIHYRLFFRLWRKLFWRVLQKHREEQAVEKKYEVNLVWNLSISLAFLKTSFSHLLSFTLWARCQIFWGR